MSLTPSGNWALILLRNEGLEGISSRRRSMESKCSSSSRENIPDMRLFSLLDVCRPNLSQIATMRGKSHLTFTMAGGALFEERVPEAQ